MQQTKANLTFGRWPVSMATAPKLGGPWQRRNPGDPSKPANAPCVDINGGYTENPIISRRPDDPRSFQMVYDDLSDESRGFGYACSRDGLDWAKGANVAIPGGTRTPFGLLPMTPKEIVNRKGDILAAGIINASDIGAVNTSLQWAFYTGGALGRWRGLDEGASKIRFMGGFSGNHRPAFLVTRHAQLYFWRSAGPRHPRFCAMFLATQTGTFPGAARRWR